MMNLKYFYWVTIIIAVILIFVLFAYIIIYPTFSYLSVIFILLGTILVSAIATLINTTNRENEVKLLTKKVLLTVYHNIRNNFNIINENKNSITTVLSSNDLHTLDTCFWESINKRLADIYIEYHLLEDILLLKKSAEDSNKLIERINRATILYRTDPSNHDPDSLEWTVKSEGDVTIHEIVHYEDELRTEMDTFSDLAESILKKIHKILFE